MKFPFLQHCDLVGVGRAPQGARGLKFLFLPHKPQDKFVAPRKGRVG